MIPIKFLNANEKKEILERLNEQFGIIEIPFNLIKIGSERIVAISEEINEELIDKLSRASPIEGIGLYFGKIDEKTHEIRLSIEATQLLKNQIKKNIFELSSENQAEEWMKGHELNLSPEKKGFIVMKYKDEFLGTGKASEKKIGNFIPKERRLRERG